MEAALCFFTNHFDFHRKFPNIYVFCLGYSKKTLCNILNESLTHLGIKPIGIVFGILLGTKLAYNL